MTPDFDLIVIGSGSAARGVAYPCRQAGLRVAMVDSRPFGGTCALRGCDPKKVLVGAAEAVDRVRDMRGKGVGGDAKIDWKELMAHKASFTDPFPDNMKHRLDEAGIEAISGVAAFTGTNTLDIAGRNVTAANIVIAAGAEPTPLNIPGEDLAINSDGFLDLPELPKRIAFIGGGYIGFEFAHICARAGVQVTILHRGSRPLENFDADLVQKLCEHTRAIGIDLKLKVKVTALERGAVITDQGRVETDLVVQAAGRRPNLGALRLDRAGVASSNRGVAVDQHLRSTTNPQVWAAGDCVAADVPRLTPVSGMQGAVVAHNILHEDRRTFDPGPVASVVFTIPPLASVGISEPGKMVDTTKWYTSRRVGETCSAAKVIVDPKTNLILGAHVLGHGAEETINIFAMAMRFRIKASEVKEMLFSYPTKTSDIEYLL